MTPADEDAAKWARILRFNQAHPELIHRWTWQWIGMSLGLPFLAILVAWWISP